MEEMRVFRRSYLATVMMKGSYDDAMRLRRLDPGSTAVLKPPAWFWNRIHATFHRLPPGYRDGYGDYLIITPTEVEVYMRILEESVSPVHPDSQGQYRILVFSVEIPRVHFFGCIANLTGTPAGTDLQPDVAGEEAFLKRVLRLMTSDDLFGGPLSPWTRYLGSGGILPDAFLFETVGAALDWLLICCRDSGRKDFEGFEIIGVPAWWKQCCASEALESSACISE